MVPLRRLSGDAAGRDLDRRPRRALPAQPPRGAQRALARADGASSPTRSSGFDADPEVRCIVIAGSDEVFAAGADIGALAEREFHEAAVSPGGRVLATARRVPDAADRRGLGLRARRRLRAGPDLRPDRRLGDGRVRPARDHARDHPRRRRHPAARPRDRQAAGDGAGAHRAPLRRRARPQRMGIVNQVTGKRDWLDGGARARRADRLAPAARLPARQAGGARRRGDRRSRPGSSRSGASTSSRWRPRTGSRACRPSSRSASPEYRGR